MSNTNPEHDLTPAEIEDLERLEAIAQRGLGTYLQVGGALAEIRDRHLYRDNHPSFEAYVNERWGVNHAGDPLPRAVLRSKPCEALAKACEQTLSALDGDGRVGIEIRLAVQKQGDPDAPASRAGLDPSEIAALSDGALVPTLRWLLTQATGTIGEVAHQLETRAADIGDGARAQLRDDVLVLDGELAVVKSLLLELVDWDSELERLLGDELPPFDVDADAEHDE